MKKLLILSHALCLPWIAVPMLWLLLWVPPCSAGAFTAFITVHNKFLHEWTGHTALAVSFLALVAGFFVKPQSSTARAFLWAYAVLLCNIAVYTIWWGMTGQQYDWP